MVIIDKSYEDLKNVFTKFVTHCRIYKFKEVSEKYVNEIEHSGNKFDIKIANQMMRFEFFTQSKNDNPTAKGNIICKKIIGNIEQEELLIPLSPRIIFNTNGTSELTLPHPIDLNKYEDVVKLLLYYYQRSLES